MDKIVNLVFPFVIRSVLIQTLGREYLGLSSLFVSILQVLSLAELGFSNAIIYNLYKPIADDDQKTIRALLGLYRKIYRIIGIVVMVGGALLLPFLRYLIHGDAPSGINIYALYLIYLLNTASTYFLFAYKSALINAMQRNDIISNVHMITSIAQYSFQIIILLALENYYLFIIVQLLSSILNNILVAIMAKKNYPQYICEGKISKEQKKDIKKRVAGLMIQKICATTRNSLDSIFISAMIGLSTVAMYSNYYTIMTAIIGVMGIITSSITASVGNSIVTESEDKNYKDLKKFNFIYMWLSGWLTICLLCIYQPFMKIWMGEENMFPFGVVILFCIYFYSLKMGDIRSTYSDAKGLWYENRFRAIAESIANVILNLVLGYFFGVCGIIAGTLISLLIINFGYGSQILFKHYFVHQKMSGYFISHGTYALVTTLIAAATYFVCSCVKVDGVLGLAIIGMICLMVPNVFYYVVYRKTDSFKQAAAFIKKIAYNTKPNLTRRQK